MPGAFAQQGQTPQVPKPNPAGLDPEVMNLARAIRDVESQGNFQARGGSGEYGAYQFTQGTWDSYAPKILGEPIPYDQADPLQQNAVAYHMLKEWKDQGLNAGEIASKWNSGRTDPNGIVGVNKFGVKYDTPSYVNNVYQKYLTYKAGTPDQEAELPLPTYSRWAPFPAEKDDGPLGGAAAIFNVPTSLAALGYDLGSLLIPSNAIAFGKAMKDVAAGIGQGIREKRWNLEGDANDPESQALKMFLETFNDRYGTSFGDKEFSYDDMIARLARTAKEDPFGFGADVVGVLAAVPTLGASLGLTSGARATAALARAGEAIARPVTEGTKNVVGRAMSSPLRALGAVDEEALAATARTRINLPAGAYNTSPVIKSLEALAYTGAGNEQMIRRVAQATDRMDALARAIVESTKGLDDIEAAGKTIAKGLESFEAAFKKTTKTLYDEVQDQAGDLAAQTQNTIRILDDIIEKKESIADTANLKFFKDKLAVATGGKVELEFVPEGVKSKKSNVKQYPAPTFTTLRRLRTGIGEMLDRRWDDPFVKQHFGDLKRLYGALSRDIGATIKTTRNKPLMALYQEANLRYAQGRAVISSQYARTIARLARNGQYSKIADSLVKPSTAIEDIPRILALVGEEGAQNIRGAFVRKLLEGARNADGEFTPLGIQKQFKKYGEDKAAALLTPQQLQGIKDIGTLTKALKDSLKMTQGSQTAFLLKTMAELGAVGSGMIAFLTGNPLLGMKLVGTVIGGEMASYFLASNLGQKFLMWGATRGAANAQAARAMGITLPRDTDGAGTIGTYGNNSVLPSGVRAGSDGGDALPSAVGARQPEGVPGDVGPDGGQRPPMGGRDEGGNVPLTSAFTAPTRAGRMKDAIKAYLENIRPGLSTEDVTKGGQQFDIGLTSVKGRVSSAMDKLVAEADSLFEKGDALGAQKKYNEALTAGTKVLQDAFNNTGIKVKPRGVGFGLYGGTPEPNYDAVAVVPKGKEDLFHYILADIADNNFHQYSVLTYRPAPIGVKYGVVDEARGISYEPHIRILTDKALTAEDIAALNTAAKEAGLPALSLKENGKAIDIINLTKYNDDYEGFIQNAEKFFASLNSRGISGTIEARGAEARFLGADPAEGHGFASYESVRDSFRTANPGYFDPAAEGFTTRTLEKLKNRETVTTQELRDLLKQPDISAIERDTVLAVTRDLDEGAFKKVPVKDLAVRIKDKSLPVSMYETDSYAEYGVEAVGLRARTYGDEFLTIGDGFRKMETGAKTLVFETPVAHGNPGHFKNTKHFGHVRVYVDEDRLSDKARKLKRDDELEVAEVVVRSSIKDGETKKWAVVEKKNGEVADRRYFDTKEEAAEHLAQLPEELIQGRKIGYITEIQSDVAQKTEDVIERAVAQVDRPDAELQDALAKVRKDAIPREMLDKADDLRRRSNEAYMEATTERDKGYINGEYDDNKVERLIAESKRLREEHDALSRQMQEIADAAQKKYVEENTTPEMQQLAALLKDRTKYQDIMLRGAIQYLEKQGVDEVRIAPPSSIAKIEGYVSDEGRSPYTIDSEPVTARTHEDLEIGDTLEYLDEDYVVVNISGDSIEVAPQTAVREFRYSDYVEESAVNDWNDRVVYDLKGREINGKKIESEVDMENLTAEDAQAMLDADSRGFDEGNRYLEERAAGKTHEAARDEMYTMFREQASTENLEDIYGKDKVYFEDISGGRGQDYNVRVIDEGAVVETLGQPSTYESRFDDTSISEIDPTPNDVPGASKQLKSTIDENFEDAYATVLKGYVDLYYDVLQKMAKKENLELKYIDGNNDSYWYSIPMTKLKSYLFGS